MIMGWKDMIAGWKVQRLKNLYADVIGGADGEMVTVKGIGHDKLSSKPGQSCLHFT